MRKRGAFCPFRQERCFMKIRIRVRDDGRVYATAMVPSGRKFIPVTAVAHVPDDKKGSAAQAVSAVHAEVMKVYGRRLKGADEAGGAK